MVQKNYSYHPRMVRIWLLWILLAVVTTTIMLASFFTFPIMWFGDVIHASHTGWFYAISISIALGMFITAISGALLYRQSVSPSHLVLTKNTLEIPSGLLNNKTSSVEYRSIEAVTLHKHGRLTELRVHSEQQDWSIFNTEFNTQAEFREFILRLSGLAQTHRAKLKIAA